MKGEDTAVFLQDKLAALGLTPREYNEFVVFWLPDSLLRVFMAYKALDKAIQIEPAVITGFERKGFTVIEWGGAFVP